MKVNIYFSRLLSILCVAALFGACSPKYGAHFQPSTSPSYALEKEQNTPPEALVRQEDALATTVSKAAERSGAEEALTDALPAIHAQKYQEIPAVEDVQLRQQEVMQEVRERLNNMSRKERKALKREIRQLRLSIENEKLYGMAEEYGLEQEDLNENLALLIILAILIPPLGVFLHQGEINKKFWISLLLTLLFYLPGAIYSVLVVLGEL